MFIATNSPSWLQSFSSNTFSSPHTHPSVQPSLSDLLLCAASPHCDSWKFVLLWLCCICSVRASTGLPPSDPDPVLLRPHFGWIISFRLIPMGNYSVDCLYCKVEVAKSGLVLLVGSSKGPGLDYFLPQITWLQTFYFLKLKWHCLSRVYLKTRRYLLYFEPRWTFLSTFKS